MGSKPARAAGGLVASVDAGACAGEHAATPEASASHAAKTRMKPCYHGYADGSPTSWVDAPKGSVMCTRVLWNDNDIAVLAGRSMDWPESTEPLLVAFPRGRDRDGGLMAGQVVVAENPLRWTSTYASL